MRNDLITKFLLMVLPLFLFACTAENEEDLRKPGDVNLCGTLPVDSITYTRHIQPILQQNCLPGCHTANVASGGIILDSYANARTVASNRNNILLRVVQREPSVAAMPPAAALPTCDIELIQGWISNNFAE